MSSFLLSLLTCIAYTASTRYYVNPTISTVGNGLQWSSAFDLLDTPLQVATAGDEIWLRGVSGHKYIKSNPADRTDCFLTNNGITIYGGFAGTESTINERNVNNAPSVISGDIGVTGDHSDNCYHVISYEQKLTLDNVIIQHGNANYFGKYTLAESDNVLHRYGGALMSAFQSSFLSLNNVVIRNNSAINGGGIWAQSNNVRNVDIVIRNSKFEYNRAIDGEYEGGYGGALYGSHLANFSLSLVEFNYNEAEFRGGAIYQDYGAFFECNQCTFDHNKVRGFGGAIFSEDRNSQTDGTFPTFTWCTFNYNEAEIDGGAVYLYNGVIGTFENNAFTYNAAGGKGGALCLISSHLTILTANTFNGNTASGDIASSDLYNMTRAEYTGIDETLSFDMNTELTTLYTKWLTIQDETDLYPITANSLCYVDIDNTNITKDGNEWSSAYNDIQQCLDFLNTTGGEIWVKSGTYMPTAIPLWKQKTTNIMKSFIMYDDIQMFGGFIATETARDQRNWRDNPTYLSCQLSAALQCSQILNAADNTLIDGFIFINSGLGRTQNRRRIAGSTSVEAILSSTASNPGAGIWSKSTNIFVVNSIFYKLYTAGKGGAVYCIGQQDVAATVVESPTFINVAFLGNRASGRGGAISADAKCEFVCKYCRFENNSCSGKGGAIYLDFDCDPIFKNVAFTNNYAAESGGCIAGDGGSFATFNASAVFESNQADMEGGCLYAGSGSNNGFVFENTPLFSNNMMTNVGIGQSDIYGWPYTVVDIPETVTATPMSTTNTVSVTSTTNVATETGDIQPNIIIVYVDDMPFQAAWSSSAPPVASLKDYLTPNMDAFVNEAVIFPNAYCAAPMCAPSRFALLTGRQPSRSQYGISQTLRSNAGHLTANVTILTTKLHYNDSVFNIMHALQNDANVPYFTGMVGKWHLMERVQATYCYQLNSVPDAVIYATCTDYVKQTGFDFVDAFYYDNILDELQSLYSHNPEWMVSQSQKFINQAVNIEMKPFFLYFSSTLTHTPSIKEALFNFSSVDSPKGTLTGTDIPNTTMSDRLSIWNEAFADWGKIPGSETAAGMYWFDNAFGALIDYLKLHDLYDKTFIVLAGDNGHTEKGTLFQGGSRVFHFVRYPPLFPVDNAPYTLPHSFVTSNMDLPAVIFEIAGITPPADYSLDASSWVHDVVEYIGNAAAQQTCCNYRFVDMYNSHSIVTAESQYIYRANGNTGGNDATDIHPYYFDEEQLYNLTADPNQAVNLMSDASLAAHIATFEALMRDYIADICPVQTCLMPDLYTLSPSAGPTHYAQAPTVPMADVNATEIYAATTAINVTEIGANRDESGHTPIVIIVVCVVIGVCVIGVIVIVVFVKRQQKDTHRKERDKKRADKTFGRNIEAVGRDKRKTKGAKLELPKATMRSMVADKSYESHSENQTLHDALPTMVPNETGFNDSDNENAKLRMQTCSDCGNVREGNVYDGDMKFYCLQCWDNYTH